LVDRGRIGAGNDLGVILLRAVEIFDLDEFQASSSLLIETMTGSPPCSLGMRMLSSSA
jgi:hypothetical protein